MGKRFINRNAREFRVFLEAHGFSLVNRHGDDDIYERPNYGYTVKIPSRNSETIPNGTALSIVRSIERCGLTRKHIMSWWRANGLGE